MNKETLEQLYKERALLKQLYSLDREKYEFLLTRIAEIKIIINSNYAPISNSESLFALWNLSLAEKITCNAKQILEDLIKEN